MKKKSFLAIMLIAFILTLGFVVSCDLDLGDELEGDWRYSSGGLTVAFHSDGYGNYSLTIDFGEEETENGTYSLDGGYITMDAKMPSQFTVSHPEYVFKYHDSVEDEYYFALEDVDTPLPYSSSDYDGPFTKTGDSYVFQDSSTVAGITETENQVFEFSTGRVDFNLTQTYKNGTTLLSDIKVAGYATCVSTGSDYDDPCAYFYDDKYTKYQKKLQYSVSGDTLTINLGGNNVSLTKQ